MISGHARSAQATSQQPDAAQSWLKLRPPEFWRGGKARHEQHEALGPPFRFQGHRWSGAVLSRAHGHTTMQFQQYQPDPDHQSSE
jgi:hypothetical protein